jgi:hypothetical protein
VNILHHNTYQYLPVPPFLRDISETFLLSPLRLLSSDPRDFQRSVLIRIKFKTLRLIFCYMSIELTRKDSTTLARYRSAIQASFTHITTLEQRVSIPRSRVSPPARRISKQARTSGIPIRPLPLVQICTTCGTPGCHFTECPQGHYVFDSHSVARPLAPGEQSSRPATWRDLHRANLQGILRLVGQYYCHLHNTPRHLENARLIVATSLGLPDAPPADPLLARAVSEVAKRLRDDPISVANSRLFASQCECYYTPVFDISLERFQQLVSDSL